MDKTLFRFTPTVGLTILIVMMVTDLGLLTFFSPNSIGLIALTTVLLLAVGCLTSLLSSNLPYLINKLHTRTR